MNRGTLECDFDVVSTLDIGLICQYLKKANYAESNHNIVNMLIWLDYYPLFKYEHPNYLLLLGIHEKEFFVYMPLCEQQYVEEALTKAKEIFDQYECPFNLSCFTKEMMAIALNKFEGYHACSARSGSDYIYETEKFRTFSGKKLQKKRNHLNAFYKNYEGRYQYETMSEENKNECLALLERWYQDEAKANGVSEFVVQEMTGIKRIMELSSQLDIKGGLIRIDGQVEAFMIVSKLTETMVQENVEKANTEIRGLYQALIQQFFLNNYLDVPYVNREDDMGLDNLRQAKLAYDPVYLLDKYWLCQEG